jgi:HSP20 family protein
MLMTALIRREPFGSLFDEVFNDFFNRGGWSVVARNGQLPAATRARMDVVDKGDRFAVAVDLPGVKKEDIQITVEGPRISIAAQAKTESEVKNGDNLLHRERFATSYARSFELPADVTEEGAEASFDNGVLKLSLPKRAEASKRLTVR